MVLIVDTSMSMRGVGGTADIFQQVKESAQDIVREVATGSVVTLISYDSDTTVYPGVTIDNEHARQRVIDQIGTLQAEGKRTYTAKAIQDGLSASEKNELRGSRSTQVVILLTDGLNDPPASAGPTPLAFEDVVTPFYEKPWYVFYVQLGNDMDADLAQVLDDSFENTETIQDPAGVNLAELKTVVSRDWKKPVVKVTKWIGILIGAVIVLAVLLIAMLKLRSYSKGKKLFGTLEYWRSDQSSSKGKADLSECGTSQKVGSEGIVLSGCDQTLFKLSTTQEDGQWVVTAESDDNNEPQTSGGLCFKGQNQNRLSLYDGDLFEIHGWNFRYRGDTGFRPR